VRKQDLFVGGSRYKLAGGCGAEMINQATPFPDSFRIECKVGPSVYFGFFRTINVTWRLILWNYFLASLENGVNYFICKNFRRFLFIVLGSLL
jgi:hypothetical protein